MRAYNIYRERDVRESWHVSNAYLEVHMVRIDSWLRESGIA